MLEALKSAQDAYKVAAKARQKARNSLTKMEEETDEVVLQDFSLTSAREEAERNVTELATANSQLGDFRVKAKTLPSKVTELESQVAKLGEGKDKAVKEKDKVVAEG